MAYNDLRAFIGLPPLTCEQVGQWAFDEASAIHKDLKQLSEEADDLIPLRLRVAFPDDFPFAPPLVFCSSPTLASEFIFDGALCMEM